MAEYVPIKRLEREYYPLRFPENMRGRRYSAILFDGCNFDCPFCFESNKDPDGTPRKTLGMMNLNRVIDFALTEVERGNPIEITGGEPTNHPEVLYELISAIKIKGGYINLATNGSRPEVVRLVRDKIDCLGLDIKSVREHIRFYTGTDRNLGFNKPLQLLEESKDYGCDVHFKRIMFKSTTLKDLEFFYPYAPHAFWILKQLRPFPKSEGLIIPEGFLTPITIEQQRTIVDQFVGSHPDLKGRLVSIANGSGKNSKNYTYW